MNKKKTKKIIKIILRKYQQEISIAQERFVFSSDDLRARINSPTGSGKTVVFTDLISKCFERKLNKILIIHPRIALSLDQQKRLVKQFKDNAEFTSFHSGEVKQTGSSKSTGRINISTTSRDTLEEIINTAKNPHITFSSYNSLYKIADLNFDLIICDESHYLVQSDFRVNLDLFKSKTIFYTATPVGLKMQEDNVNISEKFGKVIAEVKPKDLIPLGYIVGPRLRLAEVKTVVDNEKMADPAKTIGVVFKDQQEQINNKIPHKMLVAMANTLCFEEIMSNLDDMRNSAAVKDLDVYFVTADYCKKNRRVFPSRELLLDDFDQNDRPSVIIHCDTLAEGIDVTGLTGAFIFRTLSKFKFIQTIGRPARPHKSDLDSYGEVKNMQKRIKPNSIITIPVIDGEFYTNVDAKEICEAFIAAGYNELTTYIDPEYKTYGNRTKDDPGDDEVGAYGDILSVEVDELSFNLERFFRGGTNA